jgi:uncharacterized protein (DUF2384 family)
MPASQATTRKKGAKNATAATKTDGIVVTKPKAQTRRGGKWVVVGRSKSPSPTKRIGKRERELEQELAEAKRLLAERNAELARFLPPPRLRASEILRDSKKRLAPAKIAQQFGLSKHDLAHSLGLTETHLTASQLVTPAVQAKLEAYATVMDILTRLVGTWEKAQTWLHYPVASFGDRTPHSLLLEGNADVLVNYLESTAEGQYS